MISEARKTTAQYLNGLAVAILATFVGAYLADEASALAVAFATLASLLVHLFAVWLIRSV
jgi:biopolymer transport protein ExbB/TolQ